jgi:lysophospholipase L1-like esterase
LTGVSCKGREGYAPPTALTEVESIATGSVDVLVVGTGYNDFASRFHAGFVAVMQAARARGISRVVWITYREPVSYTSPSHASNAAAYVAANATLRSEAESGNWPELSLFDWNAYSAGQSGWLASDGVHLTVEGARQAAMWVSRSLAHADRRPCPAGIGGASAPGGWCA